jgi:hypothetical protein
LTLVRARDPLASAEALAAAVERGLTTPQGRARLALAGALNDVVGSLNDVVGWYTAHAPRPVDPVERIRQQAQSIQYAYSLGFGPVVRADVERRAGGSAVGTVGVDYRRQLLRSSQTAFVREAYRAAGLDLRADLARLEAEPEIVPDREARRWALRFGVPRGSARVPAVTLHTTGDGGAVPNQERWYAGRVRRHGDPAELRQLWVERAMHCSFNAAEELVALRTLLERVETGRWPATDPARLNAAARALGPGLDLVLDFGTGRDAQWRRRSPASCRRACCTRRGDPHPGGRRAGGVPRVPAVSRGGRAGARGPRRGRARAPAVVLEGQQVRGEAAVGLPGRTRGGRVDAAPPGRLSRARPASVRGEPWS